jgi:hypothetical protein
MAYSDYSGMRGLGASGSYGGIPDDIYMRKIEQTDFYEDPEQVNNHMRSLLTDLRPDKPFLAAHEKRDGNDRGGGFGSVEKLSLRHSGSRAGADPWLPDGTFLDHEFAERDPRGHALEPDMRKHRDQQFARASLIKLYDDSDYSVPESGINPAQMVANIKSGMYKFKERYQNFETSMDGWHTSKLAPKVNEKSMVGLVTMDGTITDLTDASVRNRNDATARLSADPKITQRHSTPDHRVKIARYGLIKANQFMSSNDWSNNRMSTFDDQSRLENIDGTLVNKQLASFILDVSGQRDTKQEIAKGADYGDSYNNQVRSKKIAPGDLVKLNMMISQTGYTQLPTANAQYDGKTVHRYGSTKNSNNREAMANVQINHEILNSMEQAVRSMIKNHKVTDVRGTIVQSAADNGVYREAMNNGQIKRVTNLGNRDAKNTHHIEDTKTTMNYAGIKPSENSKKMDNLDYENFGDTSTKSHVRGVHAGNAKNRSIVDHEYEQDRDMYDFRSYDKAGVGDERDHMGRNIQNSTDRGDMEVKESIGSSDLGSLF